MLDFLKQLKGEIMWPFSYKDEILGFCLFSNENSLEKYSKWALDLLSPLISSVGFTLENMSQLKFSKVKMAIQTELSEGDLKTVDTIKSIIADIEKEPQLSHNMKSLLATLKTQVQKLISA